MGKQQRTINENPGSYINIITTAHCNLQTPSPATLLPSYPFLHD